jgi:hypothetical protein
MHIIGMEKGVGKYPVPFFFIPLNGIGVIHVLCKKAPVAETDEGDDAVQRYDDV